MLQACCGGRTGGCKLAVPCAPAAAGEVLFCKDLPLTEALSKAGANFYLGVLRGTDHIVHRAGVLQRQEAANLLTRISALLLEQALDCMCMPLRRPSARLRTARFLAA